MISLICPGFHTQEGVGGLAWLQPEQHGPPDGRNGESRVGRDLLLPWQPGHPSGETELGQRTAWRSRPARNVTADVDKVEAPRSEKRSRGASLCVEID